MKFWVGACALLVGLAGCSGKGPNTDFAELRGAAATKSAAGQLPKLQLGRTAAQSVANAPDRGALVSYQNKGAPTKREGAYTWYPVAISEEHALKAVVTGEMTVPSPDGSQVKLRYERHEEHPDGNWTWVGRVEGGDPNQEAILTFGEKAVYGSIPQANGAAPLSLQTRNGVLWAVETDLSKVKNPNTSNDMMVPPALALREAVAAKATPSAVTQSAVAASAPATAANTIDVAIGYTQGFAAAQGSASAAVTRLTFLIQVGNQAYTNSQINGYLRLVSAVQVTYADNTANSDALNQLTGHNVAVPAALAPIRTARDQYGADLAVLVRKFQTPENDGCGIAWLNGAGQQAIDPALDDDYGFAVISDGNDQGTDGNSYFCAPETLVHELGHLMGSAHDRDNSKINANLPPGGTNLQYGRYAYSFGMKTDSANGNFYTIMAYGDDNQAFYRTFSNPLVVSCGPSNNLACGVTDQTDNARSLNQTIPVVASFRVTVVPIVGSARNDVNDDGISDLLWHKSFGGMAGYWVMNGATRSSSREFPIATGYSLATSGDFNGDGRADLVWTSNAGDLWLWPANTSGGFDSVKITNYAGGWQVVGSGDINGDGTADIVWHNPGTNRAGYWLMNGASVVQTREFAIAAGYRVAAIGDLSGDGRADLVWTSNAGDLWLWASSASGAFDSAKIANYAGGWQVVGTIDINADGRFDLIWHNATTNRAGYWLMNGATPSSTREFAIAAGYKVTAIGDFNNDGRGDLMWANAGDLWLWPADSSGNFGSVKVANYGDGWQLVGLR